MVCVGLGVFWPISPFRTTMLHATTGYSSYPIIQNWWWWQHGEDGRYWCSWWPKHECHYFPRYQINPAVLGQTFRPPITKSSERSPLDRISSSPADIKDLSINNLFIAIVPFHKSQCALRCRDPMSKIQNTSSQRFLATWLTVAASEQNDDWPASVSLVSVQPVIGWLKDEVARHWSHIVHRPRPHGNLPLPCRVRNGVWYCVKYSSSKSFYEMKFCGSVVWVRWQQIEKYTWYFAGLSQVFIF